MMRKKSRRRRNKQELNLLRAGRFCILSAAWHPQVTKGLVQGAKEAFKELGVAEGGVEEFVVPGSFELPLAAKYAAQSGEFDAILVLGTVVRGDTDHYELIIKEVASGISRTMLDYGVPIAFGLLAVHNLKEAEARSREDEFNKGREAAIAAAEMMLVLHRFS